MIITVFLALLPRAKAAAAKLKVAMKRWAERSRMSEEELFLNDATDHSDLKNRMRIIEERRRHANGYGLGARRYY
jgi:hypothetical protein